jgi:CheY-like chemotaxis protein
MKDQATVLIVDDQQRGREVLAQVLESEGYDIILSGDGGEAIRLARRSVPDLVLLDVMMPVMDGFEVCRHLRADPAVALVPIILVTPLDDQGVAPPGDRGRCR